ncbi:hypothetical protein BDE02_17G113000 [Populus trichocarpa]|nr:hypothetical protein BDE02_17G113000 [Populus trichocarpa]
MENLVSFKNKHHYSSRFSILILSQSFFVVKNSSFSYKISSFMAFFIVTEFSRLFHDLPTSFLQKYS